MENDAQGAGVSGSLPPRMEVVKDLSNWHGCLSSMGRRTKKCMESEQENGRKGWIGTMNRDRSVEWQG